MSGSARVASRPTPKTPTATKHPAREVGLFSEFDSRSEHRPRLSASVVRQLFGCLFPTSAPGAPSTRSNTIQSKTNAQIRISDPGVPRDVRRRTADPVVRVNQCFTSCSRSRRSCRVTLSTARTAIRHTSIHGHSRSSAPVRTSRSNASGVARRSPPQNLKSRDADLSPHPSRGRTCRVQFSATDLASEGRVALQRPFEQTAANRALGAAESLGVPSTRRETRAVPFFARRRIS